MKQMYLVEIMPGMEIECAGTDGLGLGQGSQVVVQFEKYQDCGLVTRVQDVSATAGNGAETSSRCRGKDGGSKPASGKEKLPEIVREMTDGDCRKARENESRAASMFRTAQRKIREHHLTMKLINCHYSLDKSIVFFQFSAEGRVDFRSLVRDLSGALHTRIELRQIGVRDEAGIVGGIGVCGRPFCCAQFLERFHSVNVKMAKIQRLSLNPASVSGGCGRLKCCLRYEVDGYKEMCRNLPRNGSPCETPDGCGRVMDCNALTQKVRVRLEDGAAQFKDFDAADVKPVSRNADSHQDNRRPPGKKGQPEGADRKQGRRKGENAPAPDASENAADSRRKSRRRTGAPKGGDSKKN